MTSGIVVALLDIERHLGVLGRDRLLASLRAGASGAEVAAGLRARGLPASPEVVELFGWHDGVLVEPGQILDDFHVFPGFFPLPWAECLETSDDAALDGRWSRTWLPFLADGGGDYYVADLSEAGAVVRHVRFDEVEHPVEFTSLTSFFRTVATAMERGVVHVEDGYLEMDDLAFGELAAANEPDLAWWRS